MQPGPDVLPRPKSRRFGVQASAATRGACRRIRAHGSGTPYNGRINVVIAKYAPGLAEATARTFSLGNESRLRSLFENAGFIDVKIATESRRFELPSFDAYYGPFERGGGSTGQALATLPTDERQAVREEVRRTLGDDGGR